MRMISSYSEFFQSNIQHKCVQHLTFSFYTEVSLTPTFARISQWTDSYLIGSGMGYPFLWLNTGQTEPYIWGGGEPLKKSPCSHGSSIPPGYGCCGKPDPMSLSIKQLKRLAQQTSKLQKHSVTLPFGQTVHPTFVLYTR
ncbi:UNVERIFIED_CONTAM: hypothetical protein K2H54_025406 [Gekko kuhli]